MHIDIDSFAHMNSPVHDWDPRIKIVSITVASVLITTLNSTDMALYCALIAALFTLSSSIPVTFLLKKIFKPCLLLLPFVIFLALTAGGDAVLTAVPVTIYKKGIIISVLILIKTACVLTLALVMMNSSTFTDTLHALSSLRVPDKIVSIILFSYRYVFLYADCLRKMQTALKLRGYRSRSSRRSWSNEAYLIGSLFLRSYIQTERIYNAMILRGYGGSFFHATVFRIRTADILKALALLAPLILITIYDHFLSLNIFTAG